tara:strand:+ start:1144 stop:1326 length:183 start_codon:yes stop_codon:yes gene_type:complete
MAYPTNPIYKLVKDSFSGKTGSIETKTGDNVKCIPLDEANTDYQEFLKWKADGGVPEEAD